MQEFVLSTIQACSWYLLWAATVQDRRSTQNLPTMQHNKLTLKVLVATIDALGHFETG